MECICVPTHIAVGAIAMPGVALPQAVLPAAAAPHLAPFLVDAPPLAQEAAASPADDGNNNHSNGGGGAPAPGPAPRRNFQADAPTTPRDRSSPVPRRIQERSVLVTRAPAEPLRGNYLAWLLNGLLALLGVALLSVALAKWLPR